MSLPSLIINYFTNSPDSFLIRTGRSPRTFVTVRPEPEDTIEKLVQRIRDRIEEKGGVWIKSWVLPYYPSELEKEFDEAIEWFIAYSKFEMARVSMLRSTLSKRYGKEHQFKLFAYLCQAIYGNAIIQSKPWFFVSGWKSHRKLAGMTRAKAIQLTVEEVARQKKMFCNETILPRCTDKKFKLKNMRNQIV